MKKKIGLTWRIGLALVLALSLSLVMAVPAMALTGGNVTVAPPTAGVAAKYTVEFTTEAALFLEGESTISIAFPDGTTVPASYDGTVTVGGAPATGASVDGQTVTIPVPNDISAGPLTVVLDKDGTNDITNPAAGDYTLYVWTSAETTHVASNSYTISAVPDTTEPEVSLKTPNGDEKWAGGTVQSITWEASDDTDTALTIELDYSTDSGSTWVLGGSPITLTDTTLTSYSWIVPSINFATCKVKITATDDASPTPNSASDVSEAVFTIDDTDPTVTVTAPTTGNMWVEGSTHNITWTLATDNLGLATDPIAIYYSTNGTTYTTVATGEANDGTYSWTLPAVYNPSCKVKVTATDAAGNIGSNESKEFTINDTTAPTAVTVVSPNGGEKWAIDSTQSITWTGGTDAVDSATSITLEYSANGAAWKSIATGETNDGTYSWTVGAETPSAVVGVNYLVKVTATDEAGKTASDVSDTGFTIVDPVHNATQDKYYTDITAALAAAVAGDTIDVSPGTYSLSKTSEAFPLVLNKAGVTLQATGTAAETIIDGADATGVVILSADNITLDGFTINSTQNTASNEYHVVYLNRVKGCAVTDNIIVGKAAPPAATIRTGVCVYQSTGANTVTDNTISKVYFGIHLRGVGTGSTDAHVVSVNTISTVCIGIDAEVSDGNTIASNTVNGATVIGITLFNADNNIVELNTVENGTLDGILLEGTTSAGNIIRKNTITGNGDEGVGFPAVFGVGNVVNNNNIYDNSGLDIENLSSIVVDATSNWWGQATGPAAGKVSSSVTYVPYLTAPYTYAEPVAPVNTIDLEVGWNLISLMKIPEVPAIETVLADLITDVTVDQVQTYSPDIEDFLQWALSGPMSGENATLTLMDAGVGFWVNMDSADTLVVTGYELCKPAPAVPPQYEVAMGWNMIGFKFTTAGTIGGYLGDVYNDLDAIYGYVDGAYFIPDTLKPGLGYWIAVTSPGTIYPDLVSP